MTKVNQVYIAYHHYTIEDLKWDKAPLNPRVTLPINELKGTQSVPF